VVSKNNAGASMKTGTNFSFSMRPETERGQKIKRTKAKTPERDAAAQPRESPPSIKSNQEMRETTKQL